MKTVYVIFPGTRPAGIDSWYTVRTLSQSLSLFGYSAKTICLDDYSTEEFEVLEPPTACIFIHVFTHLNYTKYFDKLEIIDKWDTVFVNSVSSHYAASNKALMYNTLEAAGISVPRTFLVDISHSYDEVYETAVESFRLPFVVKPAQGFGGQLTQLCSNRNELVSALEQAKRCKFLYDGEYSFNNPMLVQEYIGDYSDMYLRVLASKDFLEGYIGLVSPYEDKKFNNLNKHRFRVSYNINEEVKDLVSRALEVLNISVAACDLLKTQDGYKIIDINACGNFKMIDVMYNINFANQIAGCIHHKVENKSI